MRAVRVGVQASSIQVERAMLAWLGWEVCWMEKRSDNRGLIARRQAGGRRPWASTAS